MKVGGKGLIEKATTNTINCESKQTNACAMPDNSQTAREKSDNKGY